MQDRPTATELLAAVRQFLEQEVRPAHADQRLRFRTRVAANALAIVERELQASQSLAGREVERLRELLKVSPPPGGEWEPEARALRLELAHRIREGAADESAWRARVIETTRASVREKLLISNPKFVDVSGRQSEDN